jgi:DNA repair exonuclease SbcCD nuclease subunit
MFRFLHSSDLHIGKPFGNMPEDLRGRLREARHEAINRLADKARTFDASVILLAGDTFDTETPAPAQLRQALTAMAGHRSLRWVILPGNHDSLLAEELWSATKASLPGNVHLATAPEPLPLGPDVVLLPAPCTTRRPGRDLTEWMDRAATPDGAVRIGLAHGAIRSFSEEDGASEIIAPDRAARAGLDYLALGDWHGQLAVDDRTWYSGTPEPDRFKHRKPGQALVVAIAGPGAPPDVAPVETGLFDWRTLDLHLIGDDDAAKHLESGLAAGATRRQILLTIVASGRARLLQRSALEAAVEAIAPEFAQVVLDTDDLVTDCESGDLDRIDRGGALRQAAEALLAESLDERRAAGEREIAREALIRLFSYCEAMQL